MKNVSMVSFLSSLASARIKSGVLGINVSTSFIDKSLLSENNILEIKGLISKYFGNWFFVWNWVRSIIKFKYIQNRKETLEWLNKVGEKDEPLWYKKNQ